MTDNSKSAALYALVQNKLSDVQTLQRASGPSVRAETTGSFSRT